MTITYCMTVKEMKQVLKNKKDNEILDFDIYIDEDYPETSELSVICRNLDTKERKPIIDMNDGMVYLYK